MWRGYFSLGGQEVGNSARAIAYQRSSECPLFWIDDDEIRTRADDIADAISGTTYGYETIASAPWYDPDYPERSARILGLYVLDMLGLDDSTRSGNVQEKLVGGGHISRIRRASRAIRVRTLLTAEGMDALEAGKTWLDAALDANSCGQHDARCGLTDFEFFASEPPGREEDYLEYSNWVTRRVNLFANADANRLGNWYASAGAASIGTAAGTNGSSIRYTRTNGSAQGVLMGDIVPPYAAPNTTYRVRAKVRSSAAIGALSTSIRPTMTSATGASSSASQAIPGGGGLVEYQWTITTGATAMSAAPGAGFIWTGGAVNDWIEITDVVVEVASPETQGLTPSFYSTLTAAVLDEAGAEVMRYLADEGTGSTNVRATIEQQREAITAEPDVVYQARVNALRRYMHSVKCIAGPTVEQELVSQNGRHVGYVLAFTIAAEEPSIYTAARAINVPPTTPAVINDVPFNLAQQPRPVNLIEPLVTAIKQLSTNPSVEVDATGWAGSVTTVSGTAPGARFTAGRTTNGLAAVGVASYSGRIFGDSPATAVTGRARITLTHDVTLDSAEERVSLGIWGAAVSIGGATGAALVSVTASVEWRVGSTLISTTQIGTSTATADLGGRAWTLKSQKPPATAAVARLVLDFVVDWSASATASANSDIRVYADAAMVTVP